MISVIYAAVSALLICWLSFNVIKKRRSNRVSVGDGGFEDLKIAIAAQSNAVEYIPIALLLLFALEYNQANLLFVHALGILLIVSRIIHAHGMLTKTFKTRVLAMQMTFIILLGLAVLNLVYLPMDKLMNF